MLLIGRNPVSQDFIIAHSIVVFSTAIAGVAFDGVDNAVLDPLDDTGMIGFAVLRARAPLIIPIEEDNHTGSRFNVVVGPLASILEPVDAVDAASILRNDASLNITTLIRAPAHKASASFNAAAEPVPAPVRFSADITDL